MDIFQVLVSAQRGDYTSYELLYSYLRNDPSQILLFLSFFSSSLNPVPERELVGLFLKNWISSDVGLNWWSNYQSKPSTIETILACQDLAKVSASILCALITIESTSSESTTLTLIFGSSAKPGLLALGYYVENAKTIPQIIQNRLERIVFGLFSSDILLSMQLFIKFAKHIPPSPTLSMLIKHVCLCAKEQESTIKKTAFECIIEIVSQFYDFIHDSYELIAELVISGLTTNDSDLESDCLEIMNVFCDIEMQRINEGSYFLHFIEKVYQSFLIVLMPKIKNSQDFSDIKKFCSIIEGICEVIGERCAILLPDVGNLIKSTDSQERLCGYCTLSALISGLPKALLDSLITELNIALQTACKEEQKLLQKAAKWLIFKLCEAAPECSVQVSAILPFLYKSLQHKPSKTSLSSLLELAESGCKLPEIPELISKLLEIGETPQFPTSFNVVRAIIEHIPPDDPFIISVTPALLSQISPFKASSSSIATILRLCFERLSLPYLLPVFPEVFHKLSSMPSLNQEFFIAVSCLSRHELFKNYISSFVNILGFALANKETYQTAVLAIAELVRNLDYSDWLQPLLPSFLMLLDLSQPPNAQIIEALTDIVSLHASVIVPYLDTVLTYADYGMRFSLGDYEDQEFLFELREIMVLFLEGLVQGLSYGNLITKIEPKADEIVKYCLEVSKDAGGNLVGSVLGIFSDIILGFGRICCKEEVALLVKANINSTVEIIKMNAECAMTNLSQLS
jgi:hypothetical protein